MILVDPAAIAALSAVKVYKGAVTSVRGAVSDLAAAGVAVTGRTTAAGEEAMATSAAVQRIGIVNASNAALRCGAAIC